MQWKFAVSELLVAYLGLPDHTRTLAGPGDRSRISEHPDQAEGSRDNDPGAEDPGDCNGPGSRGHTAEEEPVAAVSCRNHLSIQAVVGSLEISDRLLEAAGVATVGERPAAAEDIRSQSWERHCSCWHVDRLAGQDAAGMTSHRQVGRMRCEDLGWMAEILVRPCLVFDVCRRDI